MVDLFQSMGEGLGDLRLGHPGGPLPDLINIENGMETMK